MRSDITGVILAGGRSRRFGSNKALARVRDGRMIVEKIADVLKDVFEEVMILTKDRSMFSFLEKPWLQVWKDRSEDFHPLNGLASALAYSQTDKVFVCGCDMPFVNPLLIHRICSQSDEADATVPVWKGKVQPLFGIYSRRCLNIINDLSLFNDPRKGFRYLLRKVNTKTVNEKELKSDNQAALSFFDIDTPEQFQIACEILATPSFPSRFHDSIMDAY